MLVAEYDYDTDISLQRAKDRDIAFAEGSYQTKLETAASFKRLGVDIAKIAEGTGLSIEEIKAL